MQSSAGAHASESAQRARTESGPPREPLLSRLKRAVRRAEHLEPIDPTSWYVVLDSEFHGPISRHTLAEVLAEHANDEDTPLWSAAHAEEWTTMRDVPGLADEVAACRAARASHPRPTHPGELAAFASSASEHPPPARPSTSGEIDIGAALRAISAKGAPVRSELLGSVAVTSPTTPATRGDRRSPRQRQRWLGTGIVLGGLGVASFLAPFAGPRPTLAPPRPPAVASLVAIEAAPPPASLVVAPPPAPVAPAPAAVACADPAPLVSEPILETPAEPRRRRAVSVVAESTPPVLESVQPQEEPVAEEAPRARSIEELVALAVPAEPEPAPAEVPPARREVPADAEVVRALDAARDAVSACTPVHAVAALRITINGRTGMVNGVYVDGVFAGTPAGSCIARAVRRVRVPPFSQPTYSLSYPYRL